MDIETPNILEDWKDHGAKIQVYIVGFTISILLTLIAFVITFYHLLSGWENVALLIFLAILQLFVQLIFFFHIGSKAQSKWNILIFLFMIMIVAILVIGSLWIMTNLNSKMMPTTKQMIQYMNAQGAAL